MTWVVPVGIPGGVVTGHTGVPDGSGLVRLGDQFAYLEPDQYALWLASRSAPELPELLAWAQAEGIDNPAARLEELLEAHLVIIESPTAADQLGRLSVHLLGECLGNPHQPDGPFGVKGHDGVALDVDAYCFDILLRSDGTLTADTVSRQADAQRPRPDGLSCLEALCRDLPALHRASVLRLDELRQP